MGIGDWGLGIGPNPQSPIPIYISIIFVLIYILKKIFIDKNYIMEYIDENGIKKKVPTLDPTFIIDRFKGQSKTAKYLNTHFIKRMDTFTSVRSIFFISILAFTLGNNLFHYLIALFIIHSYMLCYRVIRFWIKRWLMYMIDYCYIGNTLLIYFNLFARNNYDLFLSIYSMTSGIISLAVIICDNHADITNTDYLTSCCIHILPVTSMWAVRWKHRLYDNYMDYKGYIIDTEDIKFQIDSTFFKVLTYPFIYWIIWAIVYFILNTSILRKYAYSDLYQGAVGDFYKSKDFECLFGDHTKNTTIKYLMMHIIFCVMVIPIWMLNFYNFYFNTGYLVFLLIFLGYNQSVKSKKELESIINDAAKLDKQD